MKACGAIRVQRTPSNFANSRCYSASCYRVLQQNARVKYREHHLGNHTSIPESSARLGNLFGRKALRAFRIAFSIKLKKNHSLEPFFDSNSLCGLTSMPMSEQLPLIILDFTALCWLKTIEILFTGSFSIFCYEDGWLNRFCRLIYGSMYGLTTDVKIAVSPE